MGWSRQLSSMNRKIDVKSYVVESIRPAGAKGDTNNAGTRIP
jgi:hypothetical protein